MQCDAVCCSVMRWVAVCCGMLQCVAVCCRVLQSVALCCSVCCSMLQCVALLCSVLQLYFGMYTAIPRRLIHRMFVGMKRHCIRKHQPQIITERPHLRVIPIAEAPLVYIGKISFKVTLSSRLILSHIISEHPHL